MQTIVITGASSGVGKAAAKLFAQRGWNVAATMRHPEKEQELGQLEHVKLYRLDITDEASIDSAYTAILNDFKTVDVLFNNAGSALFGPLELSTPEQIRGTIDTLVVGPMLVTRKFIPHLRERKQGVILTVSSVGGLRTGIFSPTYHAGKYAIEGFNEALSYELAPFHILCKVIEPGRIASDFWGRSAQVVGGVEGSVYEHWLTNYLNKVRAVTDRDNTPEFVAEVAYEAATDGKNQWRYVAGPDAEASLKQRAAMTDAEWMKNVTERYPYIP